MKKTLKEKVFDCVVTIHEGKPVSVAELNTTIYRLLDVFIDRNEVYSVEQINGVYEYVQSEYGAAFKVLCD